MADVKVRVLGENKTRQAMKEADDGLKKFANSVTEARQKIAAITDAFKFFERGLGSIMEFGKQGAILDYNREKFEKLALSIGTTSDALLKDLHAATRGMVDDASLVDGAATVMGLGLVKTHDQAVRLTRVMGALNMDMNQLVLTLANKTTMRFDQLGVSVDGFAERLRDLQASGMDVNAAFTEAFLAQAEDQVNKLGDAADSAIAPFQRLEVSTKNLADEARERLAPALADVADGLNSILDEESALNIVQEKTGANMWALYLRAIYVKLGLQSAESAAEDLAGGLEKLEWIQDKHNAAMLDSGYYADQQARAQAAATKTAIDYRGAIDQATAANERYAYMNEWAGKQIDAANTAQAAANRLAEDAAAAYSEELYAIDAVATAQQHLAEVQADWSQGVGTDLASQLEAAVGDTDKLYDALAVLDEVMGTNTLTAQKQEDQMAALIEEYRKTGDLDAFREGITELKDEFMPLNEQVIEAQQNVDLLSDRLEALNGQHFTAYVDVITSISAGVSGQGKPGRQSGGPVGGFPFVMNENPATAPETYVPAYAGDVRTRQELAGQGEGNVEITFGDIYLEGADAGALVDALFRKAAAARRSGMTRYGGQ